MLLFPPASYSPVLLQSVDCFCSSRRLIASLLASFALIRQLVLLFSLMDLGGVRGKKSRVEIVSRYEHINPVKTVKVYNRYGDKTETVTVLKNVGQRGFFFF